MMSHPLGRWRRRKQSTPSHHGARRESLPAVPVAAAGLDLPHACLHLPCGVVSPCTNTTTTVAGDTYSAPPLSAVTGPEKVTNFAMNLEEGVEYISWVNPSTDSSPCYTETAVRVSFNDEDSISYFNHSQESTSKGLCAPGYGTVEVWTQGGDGHSNSSWEPIIYSGSGVVDVVTFETCEPVGCTSLQVEWSNTPVCPDVEYLSVEVGDVRQNVSTNTSNLTVTGLEVEKKYYTCIYARNKDGNVLQHSCMSYCETPTQVPENLTVKPLSTSALHFTWDPPVCQKPPVLYQLDIDYHYYTTTETEYIVDGLRSFYRYIVEVQVGQGYHYSDEKATMTAYTLPISPSLYVEWRGDKIYASWSFSAYNHWGFTFRFKVTWGESLQHEEETLNYHLWIDEFNSTDEVYRVCVAVYPIGREDLMSDTDCENVPESESGLSGWAITLIVLGTLAVIAVGVFCAAVHHNKSKAQQRQLQQQQQQQDVYTLNHGVTNPAAIT
ncbi:uncharacterized protein LOC127002691 isoform X2 [Eriocheir sinensis]|uniref:uncharacterized protein LOC127002691 isoform X2 n=1 Tax=Eriocheir sinensis TaxID=95602 RepID=UPI0021C5BE69|nr:uncharacterized protein LOC127002691 isoform X2 [Eriocheir sinensis]